MEQDELLRHVVDTCPTSSCHEAFLKLVPAIERYCRLVYHRASAEAREEAAAEATALAFQAYLSMVRRGRATWLAPARWPASWSDKSTAAAGRPGPTVKTFPRSPASGGTA